MKTNNIATNIRRLELDDQKPLARCEQRNVVSIVGTSAYAHMGLADEGLGSPRENLLNSHNVDLPILQLLPQVGAESRTFSAPSATIIDSMVNVERGKSGSDTLQRAELVFTLKRNGTSSAKGSISVASKMRRDHVRAGHKTGERDGVARTTTPPTRVLGKAPWRVRGREVPGRKQKKTAPCGP